MPDRIDHITLYEMYGELEINGKPLYRALIGGYNKDVSKYYLCEVFSLGNNVRIVGEWVVPVSRLGDSEEEEAMRNMESDIEHRDEAQLLESLL